MAIGLNLASGENEHHRRENFMGIANVSALPQWTRSAWHEINTLNKHTPDVSQRNNRPPSR